ncbi:sialidase family protein [Gaoshiqia sp. Z1-71]|uniref:sialidase family protein n=1 Tax=Gaoshiqia hydrogeniformans TaxID=3290090 RepID=UPI003BF8B393
MTKLISLTTAALFAMSTQAQNPFNGSEALVRSEFIYQKQDVDFPSCHASTLAETPAGLVAAWFGGTEERHPDVCIYTARQVNGKWGKPVLAADGIEDGKRYPCWNPVLFSRDNGNLVLYYKVGPDPRSWWGLYKISPDNGETWSEAVKIPGDLLGPIKNKPERLADGTILYPTSFETPETWNIYMETSDQDLKNWKKIDVDNGNYQTIQPTLLFYPDGAIQLLCRSKNKAIIESWSNDNGQSWSALKPTALPNNNSGIDAVTLDDGQQFLVFTPAEKGRNILGTAVSKDGKSWEAAVLLENDPNPKGEYSYPAVIQTSDGLVHITYTWNRELIKQVVIDPAKIKTKAIVNGSWPKK